MSDATLKFPLELVDDVGLSSREIAHFKRKGCKFYGRKTCLKWVREFLSMSEQEAGLKPSTAVRVHRPRSISKWVRSVVMDRDNYCCHYCGSRADLSIDHKNPFSRGGDHSEENLVVACMDCNSKKKSKPYDAFRASVSFCEFPQLVDGRWRYRGRKTTPPATMDELQSAVARINLPPPLVSLQ